MKKLKEEFDSVSDDGRQFRIRIFVKEIDVRSITDPHAKPMHGLTEAITSEGYHCKYIGEDVWEIIALGIKARRFR
jgi:hypothetical protein